MADFDPNGRLIFHGGRYRTAAGDGVLTPVDPASGDVVGQVAITETGEIDAILDAVNAAQKNWAAIDEKSRATMLHRIADRIENTDFEDVALQMVREVGKPYPEATGELANVAPIFRYYAEMARDSGGILPGTTQAGSHQFARYFPYGTSVHIVPFNFPILLMCWSVAASLAAGNGCVIKPSELTSLTTLRFMKHFAGLLPDGLIACVTGTGEAAQHLIKSAKTHVVTFTGGVETGRKVAVSCAEALKPCVIEAGGSDPLIVTEHAPLDVAIHGSVTAAFHMSGQVCTSAERFFVHDAVHDRFVEGFVDATRKLRIGSGLDVAEIGPLVNETARDKVIRLVDEAKDAGATVECGGRVPSDFNAGWYYEPTILTGCTPDMEIMQTEVFGPVASVCKVSNLDEALTLASDTPFGLGASIFTESLEEAHRAYERLEAGMVWVNNPLIDNDAIPFGGWKHSGMGRNLGRHGIDAFRQTKMGIMDWKPAVQDWWYPYPDDWFHGASGREF